MNKYTEFVRRWAARNNISYMCAGSDAAMRAIYHANKHLPDAVKWLQIYAE